MKLSKDEFLAKLVDNTSNNNHTENYLLIAEHYEMDLFVKLMKAIKAIHDTEGNLPYPISQYRSQVLDKILNALPEEDRKEINNCI